MMKRSSVAFFVGILSVAGMLAGALEAEQPIPRELTDPIYQLKDQPLLDALLVLRENCRGVHLETDPPAELAAVFSRPEVRDAIQTALERLRGHRFDEFPLLARNIFERGVFAGAIITGDKRHIEALKALIHSDDPEIRRAISMTDSAQLSVNPPIEVFREAVLSAEEHLPKSFQETQEFEASLEEFERCVERVARYGSKADRKEFLEPIVQRFLNRYSDPRVRAFYEPRLRETLDFQVLLFADGKTIYKPRDSDPPSTSPAAGTKSGPAVPHSMEAAGAAQPADATPVTRSRGLVAAIVISVAASIGLIWHIVRRARR